MSCCRASSNSLVLLSSDSVHHSDGIRENSAFDRMVSFMIKLVFDERLPKLSHDIFFVNLTLALNSAFGHTLPDFSPNNLFLLPIPPF